MPWGDDSWLSLTPEPERLLPEARAVLRSGASPPPEALLEAERARAARLVVGARRNAWHAWLRESAALADAPGAPDETRALVRDVVSNHDALALGLPGELGERRPPRGRGALGERRRGAAARRGATMTVAGTYGEGAAVTAVAALRPRPSPQRRGGSSMPS